MPFEVKMTRIFNPDNDLALGNGDANYLPPQSARQMAADLAFLPVWYAQAGDAVVIPGSDMLYYWSKTSHDSLEHVDVEWIIGGDKLPECPVSPWGWNKALVKMLAQRGLQARWLPDTEQMDRWRNLSHRSTASELLDALMERLGGTGHFVGKSYVCRNEKDIISCLSKHPQTIFKAPWSGSGKGLRRGQADFSPPFSGWCLRILSQQGAVIGEPFYRRVKDFAMEFRSSGDGSAVEFCGYSYFMTDENGAYKGNLLMSDEAIESALSVYVNVSALHQLREELCRLMSMKFSSLYSGYIGVDMMVCDITEPDNTAERHYAIHPCVEINMRMNMGVVSHILYERYVQPGKTGHFFIEYHSSPERLQAVHRERQEGFPCIISDEGRLSQGYQPLTPIGRTTQFFAGMIIDGTI